MSKQLLTKDFASSCLKCELPVGFDFTFAFQPIVDINKKQVFAYESLVRGLNGEGADDILAKVNDSNRYRFDQECRVKSILLAKKLDIKVFLSINFLPNAVYQPELCIKSTIAAATKADFPLEKIIFEVAEREHVVEPSKLIAIFQYYQKCGFYTAIDDFGAGYAGLGLLADFQPNFIKIDIKLVRDINTTPVKQAIVKGIILSANSLGIAIIAEGIETEAEALWLYEQGIFLMQGFYFAKPGFESLPEISNWKIP